MEKDGEQSKGGKADVRIIKQEGEHTEQIIQPFFMCKERQPDDNSSTNEVQ